MPHITHTPADMVGIIPTTLDAQYKPNTLAALIDLILAGYTYQQAASILQAADIEEGR